MCASEHSNCLLLGVESAPPGPNELLDHGAPGSWRPPLPRGQKVPPVNPHERAPLRTQDVEVGDGPTCSKVDMEDDHAPSCGRTVRRMKPPSDELIPGRGRPRRMLDRQKRFEEFVTAWAEYAMLLRGVGAEAKKLAVNNSPLEAMIARITDDLASSPDDQRQLAMRLAIAEFSRSA
jgi:hypothetical protein